MPPHQFAAERLYNWGIMAELDAPARPPLDLRCPLLNAAGSLGFVPNANGPIVLDLLGAFITNPISARPRQPANPPQLHEYPGGVLLHSGHPNPGLSNVLKRHAESWERATLPIIPHLLAESPKQIQKMVTRLERLEAVLAVEIGLPDDIEPQAARELIQAALGELPVIARAPLGHALELADLLYSAGASAISLGPPRGALPGPDGELIHGRLYGPALFPQALEITQALAQQSLPVIASGGIYHQEQVDALLEAGALAVQLDIVLWQGKWGR